MTEQEAIEELKERYLTMSMCGSIDECRRNNLHISMAISALYKQIPKKPVKIHRSQKRFYYACPICEKRQYSREKHCYECGQTMDWSKE